MCVHVCFSSFGRGEWNATCLQILNAMDELFLRIEQIVAMCEYSSVHGIIHCFFTKSADFWMKVYNLKKHLKHNVCIVYMQ